MFDVIIVDCPWQYENDRMKGRSAETQYATMSTAELAGLHVSSLAARDCVLLMWAVPTMLEDGLSVMKAWGFDYKTIIPWFKITASNAAMIETLKMPDLDAWLPEEFNNDLDPAFGMGWWIRGCFEPVLIGVRGNPRPIDQWVGIISENFKHSRKPLNLHMYGQQFGKRRLELFARERRSGWTTTGLECDGVDIRHFIEQHKIARLDKD